MPIPLTRGQIALVSEADLTLILARSWFAKPRSYRKGDNTRFYAASAGPDRRQIIMHRLILRAPDGLVVDHINGDGLDNRRTNLRLCTQRENLLNRKVRSRSGFRGVTRTPAGWVARISDDGRKLQLGTFHCPIEAARAYDEAALAHHGAFAMLNFRDQKENE